MIRFLGLESPCPSQLAWENLLKKWGVNLATEEEIQDALIRCPDDWVSVYEQNQSRLYRKQRKLDGRQNGVFYTPAPIAGYLLQRTLKNFLTGAIAANGREAQRLQTVLKQAQGLSLVDPACGTGVFLVAALKQFHQFYQSLPLSDAERSQELQFTLENQLFGIDIDSQNVQVARLRLLQCFFQLTGQSLRTMPKRVIAGDALLPDTLDRLGQRSFSLVVGNPPYISEVRGQAENFRRLKECSVYYQAKMDLCDAFLAWALHHLEEGGQMAYVLPEYWTQRSSIRELRKQLILNGKICEFWRFLKPGVFKEAPGHHTSLLVWEKRTSHDVGGNSEDTSQTMALGEIASVEALGAERLQPAAYRLDERSGKIIWGDETALAILHQLSGRPPLFAPDEVQQGVILPQGRLSPALQAEAGLSIPGVFLLTDEEVELLSLNDAERALLKPFFTPANFRPFLGFASQKADYWLIYTGTEHRRMLTLQPERFPNLVRHFLRCSGVNTSSNAPYGLHRSRQPQWFEGPPRILSPRQVQQPSFALIQHPAYVGEGFYSIRSQRVKPQLAVAILNSPLAHFWFYRQKRKGERLQIDKDVLCAFPQPPDLQSPLTTKLIHCSNMLQGGQEREQNRKFHRQISNLVYQLYGLSPQQVLWLSNQPF
jgi:hypothetical protein